MNTVETMRDFFTARVSGYDEHMLEDVIGCRAGYAAMAMQIPNGAKRLLDLGCGTGLELAPIFERFPDLEATCIDLTQAMLDELRRKYASRAIRTLCEDYFQADFGSGYDAAVSFETMHHFTPDKKLGLYKRIHQALQPGGVYIECDYMIVDESEERFYFEEAARLRREAGLSEDTYIHYDTPLTIDHQLECLRQAGFRNVQQVFREENTTMLRAEA